MLGNEFIKLANNNFSALGRDLRNDRPETLTSSETIKTLIIEKNLGKEVEILTDKEIKITIKSGDYIESLFADLYFNKIRIDQQKLTLTHLINGKAHPAWVLVTTYYASYFMVTELSKIAGKFITNIDSTSLDHLIEQSSNTAAIVNVEKYNSFSVKAKPGNLTGETILELRKHSPRPHAIAWENFRSLFSSFEKDKKFFIVLSQILEQNSGWSLPNEVRNDWNYSSPKYFGGHGMEVGREFISVVKSFNAALNWSNRNKLPASEENIAASIGFLYHILLNTYDRVISEFDIA